MVDPGWDLKRVRTALWPSTEDWPDVDELWPEVAIEGVEQALRAAARVTPEREWFRLRRL
jgi:hypothetical protein